jgi:hypothetical protein
MRHGLGSRETPRPARALDPPLPPELRGSLQASRRPRHCPFPTRPTSVALPSWETTTLSGG